MALCSIVVLGQTVQLIRIHLLLELNGSLQVRMSLLGMLSEVDDRTVIVCRSLVLR